MIQQRPNLLRSLAIALTATVVATVSACSSSPQAGSASSSAGAKSASSAETQLAPSSSTGSEAPSVQPTSGGGGKKTTITFVGADDPTYFAKVISGFEKANPDIKVQYQNIPFDQFNNVIQQRVGAKDPSIDVMYVDAGAVGAVGAKGWLEDLSSYRAEAEKVSLAAALEGNVYNGKLLALPMWTSSQYLYYNKAILEKAGVTPPTSDPASRWTWEQVVAAGKKAQATGAQYGLLLDQTDRYYQLQALPESAGGGSGATGDNLLTADVTNAGWMKAMTWYSQLFKDKVAPRGIATDQMNVLFSAGKAAFFVGGPWSAGAIAKADKKLDFGVAPHPYFEGGKPAMPTGSWSLAVSSASDAKDAAKKFVEYASLSPEGNAATVEMVVIPPTNQEAFTAYITRLDETRPPSTTGMGALTLSELKTAAVNRPNTIGFTQMQDVLGRAFSDIRNGQDVQGTLGKAQKELQKSWDRLK